jgi:hypothetical protein
MTALQHTPYDGSKAPFSIGLSPIPLARWLEADADLAADLAEKARLFTDARDVVYREAPETAAAGAEVLALIVEHLTATRPDLYRREGDTVVVGAGGLRVALDAGEPALMTAARLVQEDLCLMTGGGAAGWRLSAAALCFPSAWSLAEKFGTTLDGLHAAVPGYAERLRLRMQRIFDNLRVELPAERLNWSIYPDAVKHHPESKTLPRDWFGRDRDAFIRVERQTLRRLPDSGAILFTIKVLVDPFAAFERHPDGARLAGGLRAQILALDPDQLRYKNLTAFRDKVAAELEAIAARAAAV